MLAGAVAAVAAAAVTDDLYQSAGHLPVFSHHSTDLEEPGMLAKVIEQVSYRKEIILVCGDVKPTASAANGLNTLMQFRALQLHHVLYLSDSAASCASLRLALPEVACVWSSRISPTKPKNGGLCVQLYWGYAFYFYDLRKHYTSRMTSEFGINVLHTDTDVVWLANPYPALKRVFGRQQIIGMSDRPMINAGVFYAQNIAAGDGASWVLRELSRRIHTFLLRPSAVRDYVPWAQPPYYANVDEQTLMNDCVRSAIANVTSFAQATAGWEVKRHRTGTLMNKSFVWKRTPEYRLNAWLNRVVPAQGRKAPLDEAVPLNQLCGSPLMRSAGVAYPLHSVGSSAPPSATLTIGPTWLFMHLPSSMAASSIRRCRSLSNSSTGVRPGAAPFIMAHLAGVRTGAWSRRALIRAYGWWDARADALIARQLGWFRPNAGSLHVLSGAAPAGSQSLPLSAVPSQAHLDVLVANLLLLGALTDRRVVVPEVSCSITASSSPQRGYGNRPVGARSTRDPIATCAWMPPKECWAVRYATQLEYEYEMARGTAPAPRHAGAGTTPEAAACAESKGQGRGLPSLSHNLTAPTRDLLHQLPCESNPALAVLPRAMAGVGGSTLEQLARTPILRYESRRLLKRTLRLGSYNVTSATAACIEGLYRHGLSTDDHELGATPSSR